MKNFKLIVINKRYLSRFFASLLFIISIISINIIFFSNLNSPTSTVFKLLGYADEKQQAPAEGKLAIIIDDFGQDRSGVKEMMSIDRHLTFAIMPFLTFSQSDAKAAFDKGYEVIIHLPMEPEKGKLSWLGPRPILATSNENEVYQLVMDAFESVPYAVGANIHMGSKASAEERIISVILDIIKSKNLYFVDSRTAKHPVAKKIAEEKAVLCYENNIFLDSTQSKSQIIKQLKKAGDIAIKRGKAVAIGHVGKEGGKVTAAAIKEILPEFEQKNIKLVFISELGK